jgi:hypothetical protein
MMNEDEQLRSEVKNRKERYMNGAARLGDLAKELMETRISHRQERFGSIPEIWNRLLPEELRRHCKIAGFSGGRLKVLVDLPAYMYELQLCKSELLRELKCQCPRANIKKIQFVLGTLGRD